VTGPAERAYLRLVGRQIRAARVLADLGQGELARAAAVSRVTLGSIERGDHAAGLLTYAKAARALGVTMSSLLDEDAT
jgi:DNA-binding XRE family transcriptional regulator